MFGRLTKLLAAVLVRAFVRLNFFRYSFFSFVFQTIGSGFVIAPVIGLIESIAIGKAFGKSDIHIFYPTHPPKTVWCGGGYTEAVLLFHKSCGLKYFLFLTHCNEKCHPLLTSGVDVTDIFHIAWFTICRVKFPWVYVSEIQFVFHYVFLYPHKLNKLNLILLLLLQANYLYWIWKVFWSPFFHKLKFAQAHLLTEFTCSHCLLKNEWQPFIHPKFNIISARQNNYRILPNQELIAIGECFIILAQHKLSVLILNVKNLMSFNSTHLASVTIWLFSLKRLHFRSNFKTLLIKCTCLWPQDLRAVLLWAIVNQHNISYGLTKDYRFQIVHTIEVVRVKNYSDS